MRAEVEFPCRPGLFRTVSTATSRLQYWLLNSPLPALLVLLVIFGVYLSTMETDINGNDSAYGTDVGEIQNALPRWGTIHGNGYPLYMLAGSTLVTALRAIAIPPAAGASLYSALAALACLALLIALSRELGVPYYAAGGAAAVVGLSTSFWMNAAIAEVHAFTLALTAAILLLALRFYRTGSRRDLLCLALCFFQGIAHQQAVALLAPALLVLVLPRWQRLWESLPQLILTGLTVPLVYLYLPLRQWMGADWLFGSPGTLKGFLAILFDTKAGRVTRWPTTGAEWLERGRQLTDLLAADLPLGLLALGLAGLLLLLLNGRRRVAIALTLVWLPYLGLSLVIWEGRVSDALLAAKMPIVLLAGVGLAIVAGYVSYLISVRSPALSLMTAVSVLVAFLLAGVFLYQMHLSAIIGVTRDRSAEEPIAIADRITPARGEPATLMSLWGRDFWALKYAQAYRGQLQGLRIVDHNADLAGIVQKEGGLLVLSRTFELRPLSYWDQHLGKVYLSSPAPDVIAIRTSPLLEDSEAKRASFDLGNGVRILSWEVRRQSSELLLSLRWQATSRLAADYHVAVHLLARNPPSGPSDVLAQADRTHPVSGTYPTSRWEPGEVIPDCYSISVPSGSQPTALRIAMYLQTSDGRFENSQWLVVPLS